MNNYRVAIFLLFRFVIRGVIGLLVAVVLALFLLKIFKRIDIVINIDLFFIYSKNFLIGGVLIGIGTWIFEMYCYYKTIIEGKNGLDILITHGYRVEINEISPLITIPFYKIDGELFNNYVTIAADTSFLVSGIRKIIRKSGVKNIVINLAESSLNIDKVKKVITKKIYSKLDNILIIDKSGNVIKLK